MANEIDKIPGIEIIRERLRGIDPTITISTSRYDFDKETYHLTLQRENRKTEVQLDETFLEDLRDNPSAPTSSYSQSLNDKLMEQLLVQIENDGLIIYNESALKYLVLKFFYETCKTSHANKYNVIGRGESAGNFEQWLKETLADDEKQTLIWVWDELRRQRLIAPTGKDLINPDDWYAITDKGIAAVEGKNYSEFGETAIFINKGEVYTGYKAIKCLMKEAKQTLFIIDSYMSDEVLDMIDTIDPKVKIKIITKNLQGDFKNAYKKMKKQRGKLEVKILDHFHDRFIILDENACYQLGGSIKDAGSKAMVLDKKEDNISQKIQEEANKVWKTATILKS